MDKVNIESKVSYVCNRCKKPLGSNKDILFIADSGEYLCNDCNVGVEPVSPELRENLKKYDY